jgi:integration host factor subunit alpha
MQAGPNDPGSKEELADAMTPIGQALDEQRLDSTSAHGDAYGAAQAAIQSAQPAAPAPAGEQFTLTKAELAEMLFERVGLNKREAKDMVETFFDEIRGALERGECVKLSGFGNFQLRDKPQRPGRNPKTGEEIPISARRVVTFHASQKLKAQIEGIED